MWKRNLFCTVVTLGTLWLMKLGIYKIADMLDAKHSNGGLAVFMAMCVAIVATTVLICWAVDVRAARQRARWGK